MSDVGDVARAVEIIGKIVFSELNPSKQRRIKEAYEKSEKRISKFADNLLHSDIKSCYALWLGCVPVIPINLSTTDIDKLNQLGISKINGMEWLGQFACAQSAEFLKEVRSILAESDPVDN